MQTSASEDIRGHRGFGLGLGTGLGLGLVSALTPFIFITVYLFRRKKRPKNPTNHS